MEWAAQLYVFTFILAITGWVAFTVSAFGYERRIKSLERAVSRMARENRNRENRREVM